MFTSRLLLAIAVAGASFAVAEPVSNQISIDANEITPFQFSASGHTLFLNKRDPLNPTTNPANHLLHEMTLRGQTGPYSARLQTGSRLAVGPQPEGAVPGKSLILEKKLLEADWEFVNLKVGDSYQELGRGIALSLFRDDVFGINNTLEGISVRAQPSGWDMSTFVGRVNTILLPVALNPLENPLPKSNLWLAGGAVKVPVQPGLKVGGHAVLAYNQPFASTRMDQSWNVIGLTTEAESLADGVDFYGESNYLYNQFRAGDQVRTLPTGWGSYAALSFAPQSWKFKIEGKDYRDFNFDFRKPPSLEEDVVEVSNLSDVSASRFQVEKRWLESRASATSSVLVGYDRSLSAPLYHCVAGGKLSLTKDWEMEVKAGYRYSVGRNDLSHVAWKNKWKIHRGESLEFGFRKQLAHKKLDLIPILDDRNIVDLTYNFSEKWSASFGYENVPSNEVEVGNHFFNLGAVAKLGALTARAFIGQTSGGTLCSGGICRQVPAFTGATVESLYAF